MSRFLFAEFHGDDAGDVLARMLGGEEPSMVEPQERDNTSRIVGFSPNPEVDEQPELDMPDEDE